MGHKKAIVLDLPTFERSLTALFGHADVHTEAHPSLRESDTVLVALSGGPDSVALLHLICTAGAELGFMVTAAHVNYGLRGKESDEDEQFCRELCRRLGVRLHVKKAKILTESRGMNLQARARRIRYGFFSSLCDKQEIPLIATGHNKTDNVETILMNLGRGAGTFGLSGIAPLSGKIIRPLLDFTRDDIIAYLKRMRLPYRIDQSNLQTKYTRNKVRQSLVPMMQQIFGDKAVDNICRTGMILRQQEQFVRAQITHLLARDSIVTPFGKIALDLKRFRRYDTFTKQLVVAACFERLIGSLQDFDLAAALRVIAGAETDSGRVDLTSGVTAEVAGKRLYVYRSAPSKLSLAVSRMNSTLLHEFGLELSVQEAPLTGLMMKGLRAGKNLSVYVDKDRVRGKLSVRTADPGDRFAPLGMKGSKKLSDFFVDRKIDRPLREEIPLLLCGSRIVWIIGHQIADGVKIAATTKRVLKLEVTQHRPF